jgi:hypothetical protein
MKNFNEETKLLIISAIGKAYAAGENAALQNILQAKSKKKMHEEAVSKCIDIFEKEVLILR